MFLRILIPEYVEKVEAVAEALGVKDLFLDAGDRNLSEIEIDIEDFDLLCNLSGFTYALRETMQRTLYNSAQDMDLPEDVSEEWFERQLIERMTGESTTPWPELESIKQFTRVMTRGIAECVVYNSVGRKGNEAIALEMAKAMYEVVLRGAVSMMSFEDIVWATKELD